MVETGREVGVGVVIGIGVDEGAVEDWAGIVPLALVVIVAKIRLAIAVSVPGKFRVGANGAGVGIRPQAEGAKTRRKKAIQTHKIFLLELESQCVINDFASVVFLSSADK